MVSAAVSFVTTLLSGVTPVSFADAPKSQKILAAAVGTVFASGVSAVIAYPGVVDAVLSPERAVLPAAAPSAPSGASPVTVDLPPVNLASSPLRAGSVERRGLGSRRLTAPLSSRTGVVQGRVDRPTGNVSPAPKGPVGGAPGTDSAPAPGGQPATPDEPTRPGLPGLPGVPGLPDGSGPGLPPAVTEAAGAVTEVVRTVDEVVGTVTEPAPVTVPKVEPVVAPVVKIVEDAAGGTLPSNPADLVVVVEHTLAPVTGTVEGVVGGLLPSR